MPYDKLREDNLVETLRLVEEKSGWSSESISGSNGDLVMDSKVYKDGLKVFRGVRTIPGTIDLLSDIVWNASEAEAISVDKYVKKFKTVKTFKDDPDTRVDYAFLSFPWPIWSREAMYAIFRRKLSDNKMAIWAGSVDDVKIPPQKKTVRMVDILGAVFFEQIAPNKCQVTRVIFGNPAGSLPTVVTNNMGAYQVAGLLNWVDEKAKKTLNSKKNVRSRL